MQGVKVGGNTTGGDEKNVEGRAATTVLLSSHLFRWLVNSFPCVEMKPLVSEGVRTAKGGKHHKTTNVI